MLDKDVSIVNLNPYTWRNLGRILGLGKYNKNLYVLYDNNGVVINTYSDGVNIILKETLIQNVECYAKKTLKEHNDIQRIYLLTQTSHL
ncbi:hypothetical protein [Thermoanaerobacterium thermosulfurigenes]|uniref:hypothetical protein n=1 Tax=Thermoanaerobacterium thermosulfurigenes TaxID=33950 RepID=UPI003EF5E8AA